MSCSGELDPTKEFKIELAGNQKEFHQNDTVDVAISSRKDIPLEKVKYLIDGKELPVIDNKLVIRANRLGNKLIEAQISYEGKAATLSKKIRVLAHKAPEIYTYEIISEYPHDMRAFTQGLEFYKDTLYESTGKKGMSSIRKVDFKTGEVLKKIDLKNTYFGEGITIMNDQLVQLTWQSGLGFTYDINSWEKTTSFQYGKSKEGWGLCNDGEKIYKSDGTEKIWILNPNTLVEEDFIETVTNKSIFNKANELEYVEGKIYANVWQKESMMIIDANSGAIEGVINFAGLKNKVKKHDQLDVLNGVAYHPTRKTFFVTGKNWDKLFEIKIKKKADANL